jgi:hypothetical protein
VHTAWPQTEYFRAFGASLPAALGCTGTVSTSLLSPSPSPAALNALTAALREVLSDTVAVVCRSNGAQEVLLLHDTTTVARAAARAVSQRQAHGPEDAVAAHTGMASTTAAPWWAAQAPGGVQGGPKVAPLLGTTPLTAAGLVSPPSVAAVQRRLHWEEHGAGEQDGGGPPGGYGGGIIAGFEPHAASPSGQEQQRAGSLGDGSGHEPKSRQGVPMDARLYVTWRSQVVNPPATPAAQSELVPTLRPEDLWEFFSKFGAVAFCDVHGVRTPTPGASPAPRRHGMPGAGYAFVGFSAPGGSAAAHALLQVPSHSYRGAEIRVKLWRSSKAPGATGQQQQQQQQQYSAGVRQDTASHPSNGDGGGHRYLSAPEQGGSPSGHTHAHVPVQQLYNNGGAVHAAMHGSHQASDAGNDPLAALTHELQARLALDTHSRNHHHHQQQQWHGHPLMAPSQGATNAVHGLPGRMGPVGVSGEQAPAAFGGAVMPSPWAAAAGIAPAEGTMPSAWLPTTGTSLQNAVPRGGLWAAHGMASVDLPVRY